MIPIMPKTGLSGPNSALLVHVVYLSVFHGPLIPFPSTLLTRAPIGPCMGMPKSLARAGVGQAPAAGRRMKHRNIFAQVLPTQNYVGTAWACPIVQALRTLFACPRSCLGMHDWGPIGPAQSFAWAYSPGCFTQNAIL